MSMKKYRGFILIILLISATTMAVSQDANYLSQKLLLENTIQQRVTTAISKILDESQFVVDVAVAVEFTPASRIEQVYTTPGGALIAEEPQAAGAQAASTPERETNPFPIPGFPNLRTEDEGIRPLTTPASENIRELEAEATAQAQKTSDLLTGIAGGLPKIKSLALNIILEDGVTPGIIENVRQVALIASRFDRERGDVLSITTASFKDGLAARSSAGASPEAQAQVNEQTAALKTSLEEAQRRNEDLMEQIRARELEYLERSESERRQALDDLAKVQNERAKDLIFIQQQREESNSRLQDALLNEIGELRQDVTSGRFTPEEADVKQIQARSLEDSLTAMRRSFDAEKERLQEQIQAAATMSATEARSKGLTGNTGLMMAVIAFFLLALVVIIVMLMSGRHRQQTPAYPQQFAPPYPPQRPRRKPKSGTRGGNGRPPKKRKKPAAPVADEESTEDDFAAITTPAEEATATQALNPELEFTRTPSQVMDDPDVLRSEIKSLRQSLVAMSVGRQGTATHIVSDWLQESGAEQPAEAPEGATPADKETPPEEGAES